ncbi:MAG: PLP-dependent aminotransferase family protein [SAR202 cluster bacterium]|nr:PLP-dependent aminotransferase family protein [SAR202 cluster bacterium]
MPQKANNPKEAAKKWQNVNMNNIFSDSARTIGAGSATAAGAGWKIDHPNPIIAAGGIPDSPTLPSKDIMEAFQKVLVQKPSDALKYGGVMGFDGLRNIVAQRQTRLDGLPVKPENVIIHNGGSGCLDNIAQAFINPGDVVIIEDPNYSGTTRAIQGHMANVVGAEVDDQGINPDAVESAIKKAQKQGKRVKMLYVTPDYQNPTATVLPEDRRAELIKMCAENEILIVEDCTYSELYFDDPVPPSMYAMAGGQGVLKLGTFSKVIATGLRAGWVQAPKDYIDAMGRVRFDMGTSPLLIHMLDAYIGSGKLEPHIKKVRAVYAKKNETLATSLLENCGPQVKFNKPTGGFFLWFETPNAATEDVLRESAKEGLLYTAGKEFYLDKSTDKTHGRMAFSNASLDQLEAIGQRLGRALQRVKKSK